ncbi:hypothetical protein BASA61_003899 [Batrachochytrium salamandrivorans]|nr:hypothetical protein BASA61_003899 [Batrachochytrium salamandrivorans]KAH9253243.1 hypothetical protein BASA81_008754 [Batrachochytrium salamandrivorans]KAH9274934.1 hypothetical protein BASA83_002646 [Batrachochytrium salamandrivorans]
MSKKHTEIGLVAIKLPRDLTPFLPVQSHLLFQVVLHVTLIDGLQQSRVSLSTHNSRCKTPLIIPAACIWPGPTHMAAIDDNTAPIEASIKASIKPLIEDKDNGSQENTVGSTFTENALRHSYLRLWTGLVSTDEQPVDITFRDGQTLQATLRQVNATQSLLNVSDLNTPLGTYSEAQLRMQDVCTLGLDVHLPKLNTRSNLVVDSDSDSTSCS